jgi:hypothetical protein
MKSAVCIVALALSLAPMATFASTTSDHSQAELANAEAQLSLAQQQASDIANQAAQSATNERQIAVDQSTALRQSQLDNVANAAALQQLAAQLADQLRTQGDANARNELAILQIKAGVIVAKADASLTNALAIGRPDEIANARAQDAIAHQLADFLTGTLAPQNMSSSVVSADADAAQVVTDADVQAANNVAMGDDDLLAADVALADGEVAADSAEVSSESESGTVVGHASASLANAEAQAAAAP